MSVLGLYSECLRGQTLNEDRASAICEVCRLVGKCIRGAGVVRCACGIRRKMVSTSRLNREFSQIWKTDIRLGLSLLPLNVHDVEVCD